MYKKNNGRDRAPNPWDKPLKDLEAKNNAGYSQPTQALSTAKISRKMNSWGTKDRPHPEKNDFSFEAYQFAVGNGNNPVS